MWILELVAFNLDWPRLRFQIEDENIRLRDIIVYAIEICREKGGYYTDLQVFLSKLIDDDSPISSSSLCDDYFNQYIEHGGATHGVNGKYLHSYIITVVK